MRANLHQRAQLSERLRRVKKGLGDNDLGWQLARQAREAVTLLVFGEPPAELLVFGDWLQEQGVVDEKDQALTPAKLLEVVLLLKDPEPKSALLKDAVAKQTNPEETWEWAVYGDAATGRVVHPVEDDRDDHRWTVADPVDTSPIPLCQHEGKTYHSQAHRLQIRVFRCEGCPRVFVQLLHGSITLTEARQLIEETDAREAARAVRANPVPGQGPRDDAADSLAYALEVQRRLGRNR